MSGTMDKIKAKVDNVLHKDKTHDDPTGPHSTHSANKADPRVDSDRVGTAGNTTGAGGVGTGQYGEHHTTGHTTGQHTTGGLAGSTGTHGTHGTTGYSDPTGPHDSRLANKADPRVDSDRVGAQGNTSGAGGYGTGQYGEGHHTTGGGGGLTGHSTTGGGLTGHSTTGTHGTTGGYSDPTGPHNTRLANQLDPRVDSDRVGAQGNTAGAGGYGTGQYGEGHTTGHHTTGHGTTGGLAGHSTTGGYGSDPTGPHDSRLANKADPRVDSDRVGAQGNTSGAGGYGTGQYGEGHTTGHHTTGHGTTGHGTTGGYGGNTVGSGTANKTAGPHNSDLLNKMDPRVDSDLDGSKTYGGNQTHQ